MLQNILLMLVFGGLSASNVLAERIVGGSSTVNGEYPFAVSVRGVRSIHDCAGIILSNRYILTSASCVYEYKDSPNVVTIQFGVRIITQTNANARRADEIIIHEDYNSESHVNDIALIRLIGTIPLGENVVAAKLAKESDDPVNGAALTVIGWGFEEHGGDIQKELLKATLNTVTNAACATTHRERIYSSNLCAGFSAGIRGPCTGDLGGPLMKPGSTKLVVGLVSWFVEPCGRLPFPAVFTRVSHYLCWITLKTSIVF